MYAMLHHTEYAFVICDAEYVRIVCIGRTVKVNDTAITFDCFFQPNLTVFSDFLHKTEAEVLLSATVTQAQPSNASDSCVAFVLQVALCLQQLATHLWMHPKVRTCLSFAGLQLW